MQQNNQMMQQLSRFMNGFKGNPREQAMQRIQQLGMSQTELNAIQQKANEIYGMAQQMGLIR